MFAKFIFDEMLLMFTMRPPRGMCGMTSRTTSVGELFWHYRVTPSLLGHLLIAPNTLTENCLCISSNEVPSVVPGIVEPALLTARNIINT